MLSETEKLELKRFAEHGVRIVVCGTDATGFPAAMRDALPTDPARTYFEALDHDFATATANPPAALLKAVTVKGEMEVDAPPTVAANFGMVDGTPHAFLANFGGLVPSKVAIPVPAADIRVRIPVVMGTELTFLPFLGERQVLRGQRIGDKVEFTLPPVERGAIVWVSGKN